MERHKWPEPSHRYWGAIATSSSPPIARPSADVFPWRTNIVTTVFWVGEQQVSGKTSPQHQSVWDKDWLKNYGGVDDPEPAARRDYIPISFVPRQNPFYCALPYNDVEQGNFKPEAPDVIPWFKQVHTGRVGRSAKIAGSPFERGIASATHNGKIPARFARTIFSTFFRMNGRRRMQVMVQVLCFSGRPRLSQPRTKGCGRLAIRRNKRCASWPLASLRRKQSLRQCATASGGEFNRAEKHSQSSCDETSAKP